MRPMFDQRTLPVSEDVVFRWRLLVDEGRKVGHTFPEPDLFLAATALQYGLTLVTRNVDDYQRVRGLALVNPWRAPLP
jgi:toxin FitB